MINMVRKGRDWMVGLAVLLAVGWSAPASAQVEAGRHSITGFAGGQFFDLGDRRGELLLLRKDEGGKAPGSIGCLELGFRSAPCFSTSARGSGVPGGGVALWMESVGRG
ncbi:MAG: hypothetical protein ACE5JI_15150 [Acidobacteriota bacterium]